MNPRPERVAVAIVGGGLAGSALAIRLASAGRDVVVLERSAAWRWRAGGVFTTPLTVRELRGLGLDASSLARVARPLPAMRLESKAGARVRLTYGDDGTLRGAAVGLDRSALDPLLLEAAAAAGARVERAATVERIEPRPAGSRRLHVRTPDGQIAIDAAIVAGADGIRSTVAAEVGVVGTAALGRRIGLTTHLAEGARPMSDARMVVIENGYCGVAPVPGSRVNVGIVLSGSAWQRRLAADGAERLMRSIVSALPPDDGRGSDDWRGGEMCDHVAGAVPIAHAVRRLAGPGWLLVGDAAGFLDPFTGEGIHRALVSARLAAASIEAQLAGEAGALARYERSMRARFRAKDLVSRLVQAFLAHPIAFEYATSRLARRAKVRETMGLVMGDLVPASRSVDPRFLAALLAP